VLYGLVAFGQIQLRKIDGHTKLPSFLEKEWKKVAQGRRVVNRQQLVTPSGNFHKTRDGSESASRFLRLIIAVTRR